eukprot:382608-Rhodomonas_salina.2
MANRWHWHQAKWDACWISGMHGVSRKESRPEKLLELIVTCNRLRDRLVAPCPISVPDFA